MGRERARIDIDIDAQDVMTVIGMAALWPSVHNQLMFPLTFTYNKVDAPPVFALYLLYVATFCVTCVVLFADRDRVARSLLSSGRAVALVGALGALGMALLCWCDFSTPLMGALAAVGAVLVSIYVPVHFAFWGMRLIDVGDGSFAQGHRVAIATCASYALFCLVTAVRLTLGVHGVVLALVYPLVTTVLAPLVLWAGRQKGQTSTAAACTGNATFRQLPWNVVAPSLFFVLLCAALISLLNPAAALNSYPPSRAFLYWIGVALAAAVALIYLRTANASRRAAVRAFSVLSVYLVGMILATSVSAISTFRVANFPIIAGRNAFDLLLFVVILVCAHNKHVNPVRFVMGFLLAAILVPNTLSAAILALAGNYSEPFEGNVLILAVMVVAAFCVVAVANVILVQFLAKRPRGAAQGQAHEAVVTREEERRRARDAETLELARKTWGLTDRESDIVQAMCGSASTDAIAEELYISKATVYSHLKRIYRKTGVHSRQELVTLVETLRR